MSPDLARGDWIELFLRYTQKIPSPKIFRLWAGIACVAGALERRVWTLSLGKKLYPNLYTLFISAPGGGKTQAIEHAAEFWASVTDFHSAPHDMTKASLVDALAGASRRLVLGETHLVEYHSLLIAADEFGVLVPAHDLDFLSTLNRLYDNPPVHQQNRRGLKEQISIINPQLNIVGGTQPAYLATLLPEEAWGMGFMSRVIMIYSAERIELGLGLDTGNGYEAGLDPSLFGILNSRLKQLSRRYGQLMWRQDAAEEAESWVRGGMAPMPEHSKMEHYNQRRRLHFMKLAMISACAQDHEAIELDDILRAKAWLLEAEAKMPDVFREMVLRSDAQVIDELHYFAWQRYLKTKAGLPESTLIHFLRTRLPSEKISRVLDIAERANIFERVVQSSGPALWRPRPKDEHGVE